MHRLFSIDVCLYNMCLLYVNFIIHCYALLFIVVTFIFVLKISSHKYPMQKSVLNLTANCFLISHLILLVVIFMFCLFAFFHLLFFFLQFSCFLPNFTILA